MLIDWFTVAVQLLNFLVLVWLMKRFLYQPVLAAIAARESLIAAELADAAARQGAAQQLGAEFAAKHTAFDQQRAALMVDAVAAAKASNAALLQQGQAANTAQRAEHAAALAAEQARICAGITLQARDEVLAAVRQALADLGDEKLEAAMVRTFMRRLGQLDAASRASLAAALAADPGSAEVRTAFTLDATQQAALSAALGAAGIAAQTLKFGPAPDLLCGIEFRLKGWSLAWNLDQYLQDFAQRSGSLLQGSPVPAAA
ncbi:MAG: H+-transporting two-sector ATPase, subunit [Nevskia sp.]|nr:H+-transporting two-sector ATPase, subunit [Nevskia sp.]